MDRTGGVAPLLSLDAVVIDTETTGLDPRKARVIELAGVRLSGGKLDAGGSFRQLLRPAGESIPPEISASGWETIESRLDKWVKSTEKETRQIPGKDPMPGFTRHHQ